MRQIFLYIYIHSIPLHSCIMHIAFIFSLPNQFLTKPGPKNTHTYYIHPHKYVHKYQVQLIIISDNAFYI